MTKQMHIGLDVGSTTVKIAILDEKDNLVFSSYQRHFSDVQHTVSNLLQKIYSQFRNEKVTMNVTGSSGMSTSEQIGIPFIQEVIACQKAVERFISDTDVAIELGAKMPRSHILGNRPNSG